MRYNRNDGKNSITIRRVAIPDGGPGPRQRLVPAALLIELTAHARVDPAGRRELIAVRYIEKRVLARKCSPLDCRTRQNLLIVESDLLPQDRPGDLVKVSWKKQEAGKKLIRPRLGRTMGSAKRRRRTTCEGKFRVRTPAQLEEASRIYWRANVQENR